MSWTPAGWNQQKIIDGLHTAMNFGLAVSPSEQPTFFMKRETLAPGAVVDAEKVPFDPTPGIRTAAIEGGIRIPCAVDFSEQGVQRAEFGDLNPVQVKLTVLEPDHDQIEGFFYVEISGTKYYYRETAPVIALGDVNVYSILCSTVQEN